MSEELPTPLSDRFPVPKHQFSSESFADLKKTIFKLRLLAPIKMKRIDAIRQERAELLDVLKQDSQQHFLGADRFHRIMDYRGTEGRIVMEVLNGTTAASPVTGNLWSEVLLEMGTHIDVGHRSQIYAELLDAREQKPLVRKRIDRVLAGLEQIDPEIRQRAIDENFFRENKMDIQSEILDDTLGSMF